MKFALGVVAVALLAATTSCAAQSSTPPQSHRAHETSQIEYLVQCMEQAGWKVQVTWDNGISGSYNPSQQSAYESVFTKCRTTAGKKYPAPSFDAAAIRAEYAKELKNRQCFINHGFAMPAAPSEQSYLDTFNGSRYEAYSAVQPPAVSPAQYKKLLTECWPPSWSENG